MLGEYGYKEEEEEPLIERPPTLPYAMVDVPRIALMSAEDMQNSRDFNDSLQTDEGIVEDISKLTVILLCLQ